MENLDRTLELQKLIFGDRNVFIFNENKAFEDKIAPSIVSRLLITLDRAKYAISNPHVLFDFDEVQFTKFKDQLAKLIESNSKTGHIFRKTFADTKELSDYTSEEWTAMLAQYSIDYGWTDEFTYHFENNPYAVLDDYVGTLDLDTDLKIDNTATKVFLIGGIDELEKIALSIIESKTVLRHQQIETLKFIPDEVLLKVAKDANITIKENLVAVMKRFKGKKLNFALLKTGNDVLKYIVSAYGKLDGKEVEGQLNKTILKAVRIKIPTSARKMLLNNLELISKTRGAKFLCEDMFSYDQFWKIIARYLRYEKSVKQRKKFPHFHEAVDLLYLDDRSWTFNGRFSQAKEDLDYHAAINIAKERPGFLLRNLLQFVRMTAGTSMPVKKEIPKRFQSSTNARTAFQSSIAKHKKVEVIKQKSGNVVKTDGIAFFLSDEFSNILDKKMNTKLGWQLIEQLSDEDIFEAIYHRHVQGKDVEYTTPIPAVDKMVAAAVKARIMNSMRAKLADKIESTGNVFVDDDSHGYKLQYSGRDSTEINYAGESLTPGTELNIIDLFKNKNIENPILRLGVMWRGNKSVDIDHSLTMSDGTVVYYGNPVLAVHEEASSFESSIRATSNRKIAITSSGDITSCGSTLFSTELVDIDMLALKENFNGTMFNSFIDYGGRHNIGDLECYTFFSIIDKKDRIAESQKLKVDLAQQDYAIRIDPKNVDKTGSYIGCSIDFENNFIKVLSIPVKTSTGQYSNAKTNYGLFEKSIKNAKIEGLNIGYAFTNLFNGKTVTDYSKANLIISKKTASELGVVNPDITILHPGRDQEAINNILF